MTAYFEVPSRRGHLEQVRGVSAYWMTFLFGPFYLFAKHAFGAALLYGVCELIIWLVLIPDASLADMNADIVLAALGVISNLILAAIFYDAASIQVERIRREAPSASHLLPRRSEARASGVSRPPYASLRF